LFVERDAELARLDAALPHVGLVLVVGLAGVGKSALVARFADTWPGPVLSRTVAPARAGGDLLDELRRALAERTPNLPSDADRVADLARLLDRDATLLVLDDVDRLDGDGRALLAELTGMLTRGRIVATARTHVFPISCGPERLQLVLEGLGRAAAEELWRQLDLLYGARAGFEDAWRRTSGNPFYLRRTHAGDHGADPLLTDTIAGLVGDDRELALALATTELALPTTAIARVLPDGRGEAALERLLGCLVVERLSDDRVMLHDLIRGAIASAAAPAELEQAHRQLAAALPGAGLDPVVELRERVRHLLAAGQRTIARALVLGRAAELIRLGGSGELIRCLEALGAEHDPEIRLARARVLARMVDLRRAYEDLSHLAASRETASDGARASLAHVAMLTARFDLAERLSRAALADPALDPSLRIRHVAIWLFTRTYQGHGEVTRSQLAELTRGVDDPRARGLLAFTHAFSYWLEERDVEAEEAMRKAWVFLEHDQSVRARLLGPTFWVTVLARAGKTEEASQQLVAVEAALEHFEDPLIDVSLAALRATLYDCQGELAAALAEIERTERRWERGGHVMGVHWARLHRGELLLRLGRVREGHQILDALARSAAADGSQLIVRQIEHARRGDPRRGVLERGRPTRPGERRRERVLGLLRTIAAGELAAARGQRAALAGDASLDPLEVSLVELAAAALARLAGDPDADAGVSRAAELAGRAGADPELVIDLDRWLRDASSPGRSTQPILIDLRDHEIRVGGAVVALAQRPVLRRLLYALLVEPGRSSSKASLAAALWSSRYRPERHDSALWVNLKRLRDLLHGTGLRVVTEPDGYSLVLEDGYQLVLAHEYIGATAH